MTQNLEGIFTHSTRNAVFKAKKKKKERSVLWNDIYTNSDCGQSTSTEHLLSSLSRASKWSITQYF